MDKWIPVISSNLSAVRYDVNSATLEVKFSNGTIYQYYSVPEVLFQNLLNASSKGSFLADQIKGHYRYKRIG